MDDKILIVYYSHSGNTKKIAEIIQEVTKGTLYEINLLVPYPDSYSEVTVQAKKEIQSGFLPEIERSHLELSEYNTILVGTPNWWSTFAPPVTTFLHDEDLTDKTVAVFCTHGGGGTGHIQQDLVKLCPDSHMLENFAIYGDGGGKRLKSVSLWLKSIGL